MKKVQKKEKFNRLFTLLWADLRNKPHIEGKESKARERERERNRKGNTKIVHKQYRNHSISFLRAIKLLFLRSFFYLANFLHNFSSLLQCLDGFNGAWELCENRIIDEGIWEYSLLKFDLFFSWKFANYWFYIKRNRYWWTLNIVLGDGRMQSSSKREKHCKKLHTIFGMSTHKRSFRLTSVVAARMERTLEFIK